MKITAIRQLLIIIAGAVSFGAYAGEMLPKVLVEDSGRLLRFVCDDEDHGKKDESWYSIKDDEERDLTGSRAR